MEKNIAKNDRTREGRWSAFLFDALASGIAIAVLAVILTQFAATGVEAGILTAPSAGNAFIARDAAPVEGVTSADEAKPPYAMTADAAIHEGI